jgi:hypothetical protein
MYIMAGVLVVAFFANLAVKPVAEKHIEREARADERPAVA